MAAKSEVTFYRWDSMKKERVSDMLERRLITEYEALIEEILGKLDHERHRTAVALASLPEQIRGYGHVKQAHLDKAAKRQEELLAAFRAPTVRQTAAE